MMDDTIFRADAIALANGGCHPANLAEELARLPSAHRSTDEWCTDCAEYDHDKHCCPRFNRVIRSALDDAQPRWIPCSERLPEERSDWKNVTVIDESGDTTYIYSSVGFYLSDGCWIVDNEPMYDDSSMRVLAWASLPEPYRGDGDNNGE